MTNKIIKATMLPIEWILWLVLVIIRFFSVLAYSVFYLSMVIIDFFSDMIVSINTWIYDTIYDPIRDAFNDLNVWWVDFRDTLWDLLFWPINLMITIYWFISDLIWQLSWGIFAFFMSIHNWFFGIFVGSDFGNSLWSFFW